MTDLEQTMALVDKMTPQARLQLMVYIKRKFISKPPPPPPTVRVVKTVEIVPKELSLTVGKETQLNAIARDADGKAMTATIVWATSDKEVLWIDQTGNVKAVSAGKVIISASALNGVHSSLIVQVSGKSAPKKAIV